MRISKRVKLHGVAAALLLAAGAFAHAQPADNRGQGQGQHQGQGQGHPSSTLPARFWPEIGPCGSRIQ